MSSERIAAKSNNRARPKLTRFKEESTCEELGYYLVAGVDEVGRGCLAGPVVAAAVIIPLQVIPAWYRRVRDSKLLTSEQREKLIPFIYEYALTIGIGVVESSVIDARGMTYAVKSAMRLGVEKLQPQAQYLLIDYLTLPEVNLPQKGVPDGDTLCFSIACASIVAKVFRDHLMSDLSRLYPGYGFEQNKGYGTVEHVLSLRRLGPCPVHRRLFEPVKNLAQLSLDEMLTED